MKKSAAYVVAIVLALLSPIAADISEARTAKAIGWEHLLPELPPLDDPLAALSEDQRFDFETIIWARGLTQEERKIDYYLQALEDAAKYERQFEKAGLHVDQLLKTYNAWLVAKAKREKIVNNSLDKQSIRLAGYLLPLEFAEDGVSEFLLVPYVGACIHVPPPPPNQIVFVRLKKKFKVEELFAAVWVTGTINTKATSKALTLIDGTADIVIGYHIDGAAAENYRQ